MHYQARTNRETPQSKILTASAAKKNIIIQNFAEQPLWLRKFHEHVPNPKNLNSLEKIFLGQP